MRLFLTPPDPVYFCGQSPGQAIGVGAQTYTSQTDSQGLFRETIG